MRGEIFAETLYQLYLTRRSQILALALMNGLPERRVEEYFARTVKELPCALKFLRDSGQTHFLKGYASETYRGITMTKSNIFRVER